MENLYRKEENYEENNFLKNWRSKKFECKNQTLRVGVFATEHSFKRAQRRNINEDDLYYNIKKCAEKIQFVPIDSKFAIYDSYNEEIYVFKKISKVRGDQEVDDFNNYNLLLLTFIVRTTKRYFGIENIATIDSRTGLISYGIEKYEKYRPKTGDFREFYLALYRLGLLHISTETLD